MIMSKKGQEAPGGGSAATLVGIITLLFIFYILFLPPAERESLLEESPEETEGEWGMLLEASIGKLEPVSEREIDHSLSNVYLQELKSAQVIAAINPFIIRRTLASNEPKSTTFGIQDPASTENVVLSFATQKRDGTLKITVNGYEIFQGEVTQQNPPPIPISKSYLKEINTILFEITSFGLPTKEYAFADINIIGDVVDIPRMKASETLPIDETEYNNLESAVLQYYLSCNQFTTGILDISINEKSLFQGAPSCDSFGKHDIFKEDLQPGKNIVTFKITKGNIGIEQLRLKSTLKPTKGFNSFFTVPAATYAAVKTGDMHVVLDMAFIEDGEAKQVQTNINGRLDMIDQKNSPFTRDISNAIVRGNNYIEIMPITEINIARLEIKTE